MQRVLTGGFDPLQLPQFHTLSTQLDNFITKVFSHDMDLMFWKAKSSSRNLKQAVMQTSERKLLSQNNNLSFFTTFNLHCVHSIHSWTVQWTIAIQQHELNKYVVAVYMLSYIALTCWPWTPVQFQGHASIIELTILCQFWPKHYVTSYLGDA